MVASITRIQSPLNFLLIHKTYRSKIILATKCKILSTTSIVNIRRSYKYLARCTLVRYGKFFAGPRQHSDFGSESHGIHHILLPDGSGGLQTLAKRMKLFIYKIKDGK
jgi:hypothetical protein